MKGVKLEGQQITLFKNAWSHSDEGFGGSRWPIWF
jgi:hypothetical protein